MLNIYICEDQSAFRQRLVQVIENLIMIEGFDMALSLDTDNPYQIIDACQISEQSGIYFLDVDLGQDINGIQLAEKIRQYDPRGYIVFVTTHAEMSYLTFKYKVEALDYIIKDDVEDLKKRVHQCLLNVNQKYSKVGKQIQKNFCVKLPDRQIVVAYDKILFFETSPTVHKVIMHAIDRQVEFYGKLTELESQLDERFVRCHRSFLVNKENIQEVDRQNKVIIMNNEQQCYYSSRGSKLIKSML